MTELTPSDLRHLSAVTKAEREVYDLTLAAFAVWLPLVQEVVLEDVAIAAAVDPDRAARTQEAWNRAVLPAVAAVSALWKKRYALRGRSNRRMEAELAKFTAGLRARLAAVTKATYQTVQKIVVESRAAGLSDDEIRAALKIELAPENYTASAATISRTSVMNAYNDGAEQGFREFASLTGRNVEKTWSAVLDDRVRTTHATANGQTVGLDKYFEVGGYFCQHPGDETLPAWEAVNCRCIAEFKVDGVLAQGFPAPVVAAVGELPAGWRGPIAALDRLTGDKRWLSTPPDGLRTREYPMSVTRQHVGDGEDTFIGNIDLAWIEDGMLWAEGSFDLGGEDGAEAARLVGERRLFTMSIDPDEVSAEQWLFDAEGNKAADDVMSHAINTGEVPEGYDVVLVFTDWRLSSVALVSIPAYDEARIEPVFDYVRPNYDPPVEVEGAGYLEVSEALFDAAREAGLIVVAEVLEDGRIRYDLAPARVEPAEAIVASAELGGQVFSAKAFERKATGPTPLTVDEDGSVYGHVRLYGTCYQYGGGQGDGGYCVEPPLSACNYEKFHVHGAKLDDGRIVAVGALTYGEGHVSRGGLMASQDHYNNVSTVAAKVVATEDEWGVWIAGQVTADHADRAYDILLSPMSGHWEPDADNGGHLEMLAAHIVVTPGYAVRGGRILASFDSEGNATRLIVASPQRVVDDSEAFFEVKVERKVGFPELRRAQEAARRIGL